MNTTEYFIYLLSCHLNGIAPKGEKRLDWQHIYNLAEKHNVTAIIAYEIKRLPDDCRPVGTIGAWFNEGFENTIHSYRAKLQSLARLISVLSENRISHGLFKGVVLRNYYPFPELRVGSDADVLIKPADYINALEVLKKNGFEEKRIENNVAELWLDRGVFEIHTELESINIQSKIYFATPFDDISDSSGYTYKLKPLYHLLYLAAHIAHHLQTGGASIRMVMDIDVLIRRYPEISINDFLHLSDNIKIGKTAEALLAFSKKVFNTPVVLNFTFEDDDTLPFLNEFISVFSSGKVFGAAEEAEEEKSKIAPVALFKKIFKRNSKSEKEQGISDYQLQLMEELGINNDEMK